ncbi:MAG: HAD family hydrolase [Acidimicrobiia bacterium]
MAKAVVFDCDGVLVDSEELAWDAWRHVLGNYGIELEASEIAELTGRTEQDAYGYFAARGELPPYDDFWPELAQAVTARFEAHLLAFQDAESTLAELRELGMPFAVASSSPRERLDMALSRTGLDRLVEVTIAGDEVGKGKPSPDLYLAAAQALDVDPSDCVAVEDTPAGIEAARAAGMTVVAVPRGRYETTELGEADRIVERLQAGILVGG